MSDNDAFISAVECNLATLGKVFKENDNNYFFTEKELHSYFYHLCISGDGGVDFRHNNYLLLHTEYPSPFKFSYTDGEVKQEEAAANKMRGHIDCVVINPHFIDWLMKTPKKRDRKGLAALYGIGNGLFSNYILSIYKTYREFNAATGEAILLYALEFKFLRHSYEGAKYPSISVRQDIAKLAAIKKFTTGSGAEIEFVAKTKLVVFIGERAPVADKIAGVLKAYKQGEEYLLFDRGHRFD